MSDIIHLLPDSVANQIAAGEVIQRPASVVKELMENSIDAGATTINVIIKDAGRTLIQVIDNGKGMSETDARMSFERHATSKIKNSNDLFSLKSMGFRGEALASIAAVAQVELRTKKESDELGTCICIEGSTVEKQETIACTNGTNFMVKNLFFNVPARRKFLKSQETEFRNIITIFEQITLVYPNIAFSLTHNGNDIFQLPVSNHRLRILALLGKKINQQLLNIEVDTELIKISGFIGKPEFAQKRNSNQYFFVNGRYIQHPYFAKAVNMAYNHLLPADMRPSFFIYFEINPSSIDVNIHPTKTEVKFENEQAIFPILSAAVREALGKSNAIPPIDFDQENAPEIPVLGKAGYVAPPKLSFNPDYNPFKQNSPKEKSSSSYRWEQLYEGFEKQKPNEREENESIFVEIPQHEQLTINHEIEKIPLFLQIHNKYIVCTAESGIAFIDQQRAHTQVLYEMYLTYIESKKGLSQQLLFPEILELNPSELIVFEEIREDLEFAGFSIEDFGKNAFKINGIPSQLNPGTCIDLLKETIQSAKELPSNIKENIRQNIASSLAKKTAIGWGKSMTKEEMSDLINKLFACKNYQHTSEGKKIISIITNAEIEKMF